MVLLIDANVILDVLMNRQDFVKDSSMIWKLCETEKAKGYVSALTFAVTAERIHADYIITRNVRDFSKSKVIAFTPSELLARI